MYKTKLQELCHQKSWNLPEYSTTKEGQDHNPSFRATVAVNGRLFSSSTPVRSSKLAQNDAAKLAFDHFSSISRSPVLTSTVASNNNSNSDDIVSSGRTLLSNVQEAPQIPKTDAVCTDEMQRLYKNMLQSYCQKRGLTLPIYCYEREGPPHACRFKSKVTVLDKTYESLEFFPTLSKAEHAAAKVALMSLTPSGVEEDESAYKNRLQELTQKKGYRLPAYSTASSGESHKPTFVSTVEVDGESFTGHEMKTKKQAELSAAKVAYEALKQRNSNQRPVASISSNASHRHAVLSSGNSGQGFMASSLSNLRQRPITCIDDSSQNAQSLSPPHQRQKVVQFNSSSSRSDLTAYLQQNVQPRMPGCDQQAKEHKVAEVSIPSLPTSPNFISLDPHIASPGQERCSTKEIHPSPTPSILPFPEHGLSTSSSPIDSCTSLAVSSSIEHPTGESTLHHKKVMVHPRGTSMTYPSGSNVLPMSDDNWVAVRTPQPSQ